MVYLFYNLLPIKKIDSYIIYAKGLNRYQKWRMSEDRLKKFIILSRYYNINRLSLFGMDNQDIDFFYIFYIIYRIFFILFLFLFNFLKIKIYFIFVK